MLAWDKKKGQTAQMAICPKLPKNKSVYFIRSSRMYLTISHISLSFNFLCATIAG
jgi:hypothetical protein